MKKISFAILLMLVFCSVAFAAIKDSPDGFRGIKWGDPPSALGLRTKLGEDPFRVMYIKTGDQLSIGAAKLENIAYAFFQDRELAQVAIFAVEGISDGQLLLETLVARYGEPEIVKDEYRLWGDGKVDIYYSYGKEDRSASVIISSIKITEKLETAKKQAAEKGAKDF